jgi:hypothetical protein
MVIESGVVCVALYSVSSTMIFTVESNPTLKPAFLNNWYNNDAMVVFPLVPVMPTNLNLRWISVEIRRHKSQRAVGIFYLNVSDIPLTMISGKVSQTIAIAP